MEKNHAGQSQPSMGNGGVPGRGACRRSTGLHILSCRYVGTRSPVLSGGGCGVGVCAVRVNQCNAGTPTAHKNKYGAKTGQRELVREWYKDVYVDVRVWAAGVVVAGLPALSRLCGGWLLALLQTPTCLQRVTAFVPIPR